MAPTKLAVEDDGETPRAVRRMVGTGTQPLTLRSSVDTRQQMGKQETFIRFEDWVDLTAVRGAEASGVAPLWITVAARQLGERPAGAAPPNSGGLNEDAPAPGSSVCVLQGTSGLTILNSSLEMWGRDTVGLLQTVMASQIVVFPDAALGEGAPWTMSKSVNHDGAEEMQTWKYQLVSVDEAGYELHGTASFAWDQNGETPQSISESDTVRASSLEFMVLGRFDQPFPASATITRATTMRSASREMDITGTHLSNVPLGARTTVRWLGSIRLGRRS